MRRSAHHVLVVGAGSIGRRHIRCFLQTERVRVSFVEPFASVRSEVAGLYPDTSSFATLDEALQAERYEAAVIATPAPLHVPQALTLLQYGLHLLIEKPLCLSMDEALALREQAQRSSAVIAVAYVYRANPVLAGMRAALHSGAYGRPLELIACGGQHFPTFRPAYRETYYRSHATGGGAIQDALTHVLNAAQWLVGNVTRIVADCDRKQLDTVEVEDTVHALARHGDVMASYTLNQHQPSNELSVTVVCTLGMLRFENHQHRWRTMKEPNSDWTDVRYEPFQRDTLFVRQAHSFLDAIEGAAPLCDLEAGIATTSANTAAMTSWRTGSWQETEYRGQDKLDRR